MEMRLGKTLVMCRHLAEDLPDGRHLIIAPTTVMPSWEKELREDGQGSVVCLNQSNKKKKLEALDLQTKFVVVNPESVALLRLAERHWISVTFDESYKLANAKSSITKYMLGGVAKRKIGTKIVKRKGQEVEVPEYETFRGFKGLRHCFVLCGNPAPESSMNYWGQMAFMNRGTFMGHKDFWGFRHSFYEQGMLGEHDWQPKKDTEKMIRDYVHHLAFVKTRHQAGRGSKKVYMKRIIESTTKQRKAYKSMMDNWTADGVDVEYAMTRAMNLHRLSGGQQLQTDEQKAEGSLPEWHSENKFKEVLQLLSTELKGQQIIVWCKFTNEINHMMMMLEEAGYTSQKIDGNVKKTDREIYRLEFHKGIYQVMVMQIETGKVGLDLSCADTSIYLSNDYGCDARSQSEDRVVHPLKTDPVLIIDLVTQLSRAGHHMIDDDILELLREKKTDARMFMRKLLKGLESGS